MVTDVVIDVSKLLNDTKGIKYRKSFGIHCRYLTDIRKDDKKLRLKLVTNEDAKFMNLYGVFVDVETGNIALGMFPNPNEYYCVGNIYRFIAKELFNREDIPDFIDKKYILECLKTDISVTNQYIYKSVKEDYSRKVSAIDVKYKSVLMNLVDRMKTIDDVDVQEDMKFFEQVSKNFGYEYFREIALHCIYLLQSVEKVAIDFYGAFISENNFVEPLKALNGNTDIKDVLSSNEANMEQLTVLYLKYEIPMNFLLTMKSYAMGIKQRKTLYTIIEAKKFDYFYEMFFKAVNMLSSMQYMVNRSCDLSEESYKKSVCYNIIDLLRAIGKEGDFLFSLDMLVEKKNKTVFDGLEKSFHIKDMLNDSHITEEEFAVCLKEYMTNVYLLVNEGCTYTRKVRQQKYNMIEFSVPQIENAGRLFNRVGRLILKNI